MDGKVSFLLAKGISPATTTAYHSGLRRYTHFCQQFQCNLFPLDETTLCRFITHLYEAHLTVSTIRLYLSALRFHQIIRGGADPSLSSFSRLHYVLRGISRSTPKYTRPRRLPITLPILHILYQMWSVTPGFDHTMWWAACCLGFFAFLRCGEFTDSPTQPSQITAADIAIDSRANPRHMAVTLRHSKTDPFGAGITLHLGRSGTNICPISAILAYLTIRPAHPGSLFLHSNGQPLTRANLISAVREALQGAGLDVTRYSGHSFRIGAATAAAAVGLPDSLIQTLGRWKSQAFLSYIQTPEQQLLSVTSRLASC